MHVCDGDPTAIHRGFQNRGLPIAVEMCLKPLRPLADPGVTAVFQEPAQSDQVERVVLDAVVFRMLKRMGIGGQEVDCTVGRVAVFQREHFVEQLPAPFGAAGYIRAAASARSKGL